MATSDSVAKSIPKGARTIKRSLDRSVRNTLTVPYAFNTQWVKLEHAVETELLNSLESLFTSLPPFAIQKNMGKMKSHTEDNPQNKIVLKSVRSFILIGINQVTKALEKGQLQAVVLNKPNHSEAVLTDHLKVLSATRNVPVAVLPGLSGRLHRQINIHHVVAMGFKKSSHCPDNFPQRAYQTMIKLIQKIQARTPTIVLPWQHTEAELFEKAEKLKELFPNSEAKIVSPEVKTDSNKDKEGTKKRKLEESIQPLKKLKVDEVLRRPFTEEKEGRTKESEKSKMTKPHQQQVKYQTAKILQIIKGNSKLGKKKKKIA